MAILIFADNATTVLASPITSTATSVTLAAGTGAKFPNPAAGQYFIMSFVDAATGLNTEIVQVTARSTDVCTIVRGQEGTTAQAWLAGDTATNLWTAGSAAAMVQVAQLQQQAGNYGVDGGSVNAMTVTLNPAPANFTFLIGVPIRVKIAHANTGSATLNVNGLGATIVVHQDGTNLGAGELLANAIATVIFNGTFFQLQDLVFQLLGRPNIWTAAQALANNVYINGTDTSGSQHNMLTYSAGNVVQMLGGIAGFAINSSSGAVNNLFLSDAGLLSLAGGINAGGPIGSQGNIVANGGALRAAVGARGGSDTTVATLLADYPHSFLQSGFQILPTGLTIQWGLFNAFTGLANNIAYPLAFQSVVFAIISGDNGNSAYSYGAQQQGTTFFTQWFNNPNPALPHGGWWIALGI